MKESMVVGTRASPLALAQTGIVINLLKRKNRQSGLWFEIKKIKTEGDLGITGKDTFTKAIDLALESSEIDIAIHSLKDVPVLTSKKLEISAFPERESPYDVLITKRKKETLDTLPRSAKVGTSSIRRAIQLKAVRPDIEIVEIHGNVQTRLEKLRTADLDALILARAGLKRLKLNQGKILPREVMLPAPGQGCLAVMTRRNDLRTRKIVSTIDDEDTRSAVSAELAFSRTLGGGCNLPIAALANVNGDRIVLDGMVQSANSKPVITRSRIEGSRKDAEKLGRKLALQLKKAAMEK